MNGALGPLRQCYVLNNDEPITSEEPIKNTWTQPAVVYTILFHLLLFPQNDADTKPETLYPKPNPGL